MWHTLVKIRCMDTVIELYGCRNITHNTAPNKNSQLVFLLWKQSSVNQQHNARVKTLILLTQKYNRRKERENYPLPWFLHHFFGINHHHIIQCHKRIGNIKPIQLMSTYTHYHKIPWSNNTSATPHTSCRRQLYLNRCY